MKSYGWMPDIPDQRDYLYSAIMPVIRLPKKNEVQAGGHAVMAIGYDQATRRFLVRNSWGKRWGMAGYFTIPFEYLEALAGDF